MTSSRKQKFNSALFGICALFSFSCNAIAETADVSCVPLSGNIRLEIDTTCKVTTLYPGQQYLAQLGIPNTCFVFHFSGGLLSTATAYSGFTSENLTALNGGVVPIPGKLIEDGVPQMLNETGAPETRRFVTSRSVVSLAGGKLYTADAGIYGLDSSVEQIIITKGDGRFAGAKGDFLITAKLFQPVGNYIGKLCLPKR